MKELLLTTLNVAVATLLPVLLTWLVSATVRHIKDKRLAHALQLLETVAADVVAEIYQGTVANLKDPSKPGKWDTAAASAAKSVAMSKMATLAPDAIAILLASGRNAEAVDAALSASIERAVVDLKASLPTPLAPATSETLKS